MAMVEVASAETYLKKRRVPYQMRYHPETFSASGEARLLGKLVARVTGDADI